MNDMHAMALGPFSPRPVFASGTQHSLGDISDHVVSSPQKTHQTQHFLFFCHCLMGGGDFLLPPQLLQSHLQQQQAAPPSSSSSLPIQLLWGLNFSSRLLWPRHVFFGYESWPPKANESQAPSQCTWQLLSGPLLIYRHGGKKLPRKCKNRCFNIYDAVRMACA